VETARHRSATLEIAGVRLRLTADGEESAFCLSEDHVAFLDGGGAADGAAACGEPCHLTLRSRRADLPPRRGPLIFDSGGVWRVLADGPQGLRFELLSASLGPDPYRVALVDRRSGAGEIVTSPACPEAGGRYPLEYPLDELLAQLVLGRGLGLCVHACAVVEQGRAYLFVGDSGAGKSTLARLWAAAGGSILSDDRAILRPAATGGFEVHGTPWGGEAGFRQRLAAPLGAIFFLGRGSGASATRLGRSAAAARLTARCFLTYWDEAALGRSLAQIAAVAQAVPAFDFLFSPGPVVIETVRAAARV
jgi:hypothetical protein